MQWVEAVVAAADVFPEVDEMALVQGLYSFYVVVIFFYISIE